MAATAWANRIVGHGEEAPEGLLANPANWRLHPKAQQDALAGVLSEVGWVQDIIVNRRSGHVVDGHLRISLALREAARSVPVVYVDLDPAEEALILATLDPLAAMATTDEAKLAELLAHITLPDEAELEGLAALLASLGPDEPMTDDRERFGGQISGRSDISSECRAAGGRAQRGRGVVGPFPEPGSPPAGSRGTPR
jgi:hypothetical protein